MSINRSNFREINEAFKHRYAYLVLGLTVAWAIFAVYMTYLAVNTKEVINILGASGSDTLLGALIAWNGNIVQHYFRKSMIEQSQNGQNGGTQ